MDSGVCPAFGLITVPQTQTQEWQLPNYRTLAYD